MSSHKKEWRRYGHGGAVRIIIDPQLVRLRDGREKVCWTGFILSLVSSFTNRHAIPRRREQRVNPEGLMNSSSRKTYEKTSVIQTRPEQFDVLVLCLEVISQD